MTRGRKGEGSGKKPDLFVKIRGQNIYKTQQQFKYIHKSTHKIMSNREKPKDAISAELYVELTEVWRQELIF